MKDKTKSDMTTETRFQIEAIKMKRSELSEVITLMDKIAELPTMKNAPYRLIEARQKGHEFPDGTKHIEYEIRHLKELWNFSENTLKLERFDHNELIKRFYNND